MLNDTLANALSGINNSKGNFTIRPVSKIIKSVLDIMKENAYLQSVEESKDTRGGELSVKLSGNLNKCGVIKPRFSVKKSDYEKYEKQYLPAKNFGLLIVSTPKGIMTHLEAKEKGLGGRLLAYCY